MRADGADRMEDPWERLSGTPAPGADPDVDEDLESALLSYKQRKAARWGAERFAAELRRRDEAEEHRQVWTGEALAAPVEASVESQVVEGEPATFRPEPPRIGFDPIFVAAPPEPHIDEVIRKPERPVMPEVVVADEVAIEQPPPIEEPPIEQPPIEQPPIEQRVFASDEAWSAGAVAPRPKRLSAAMRHPYVPRPPAPEPELTVEPRRRWRGKRGQPEPVRPSVITAPEWARMSPGARKLYGFEEPPETRRAG